MTSAHAGGAIAVKLTKSQLTDPQHARFTTGPEPIIFGVGQPSFSVT